MRWWGGFFLFLCDCCVCLVCHVFITACVREADTTDAQQKTLCVSPFIRAEEEFPSPPSISLSFFLVQVLFCFNEENWGTWMDAILGSGLRWMQERRESWENSQLDFFGKPFVSWDYFKKQKGVFIWLILCVDCKNAFTAYQVFWVLNDFWHACFHSGWLLSLPGFI